MPKQVEFSKDQILHVVYTDGKKYKAKFVGYVKNSNKKKAQVIFVDDNEKFVTDVKNISVPEKTKKEKEPAVEEADVIEDDELTIDDGDELDPDLDNSVEEPVEEPLEEDEDDLGEKTRNELKKIIKDEQLGIKVYSTMNDDALREAIREARSKVEPVEEEPEEPVEEPVEDDTPVEKDENVEVESWYNIGEEGSEAFRDLPSRDFRFWLPPGQRSEVTIHNDKPFIIKEHNPKIGGRFKGNYFTCLTPTGQRCPLCEAGVKSYQARAFYITDHSEYTNKAGEKVKDQTRLLVFKNKSWGIFRDTIAEHFGGKVPSFKGLKVAIRRSNDEQSPGTGDIFNVKGRTTLKKSKTTEDLIKEFKPLTRKELSRQVYFVQEDGGKEESAE